MRSKTKRPSNPDAVGNLARWLAAVVAGCDCRTCRRERQRQPLLKV